MPPRKNPRSSGDEAKAKSKSIYHLFTEEDGGKLAPLGQVEGRNAEDAVGAFLAKNKQEPNGKPFVIVPDRNLSRVKVEVETKTRVKLSAA